MRTHFGAELKKLRLGQGKVLRKFAQEVDLDPAYYSRIERGETSPPNEAVLTRIALALGIVPAVSSEWYGLVDAAELSRGDVPSHVLEKPELSDLLPAFFAKLRETTVKTSDEMFDIITELAEQRLRSTEESVR